MSDPKTLWGEPSNERGDLRRSMVTICLESASELEEDVPEALPTPENAQEVPAQVANRYRRDRLLGEGGVGTVWRMWDQDLRRPVAMKVLRASQSSSLALIRFEEEAQVAAQLQHPGIIPIHDLGRLPDGRIWFTMKEVRGRTLEHLLVDVHKSWRLGKDQTVSGWTFRRMLEGFLRVCETVAYAHARGVVHRDIKPSNLMFGNYGEVLVLDWGLAKVLNEGAKPIPEPVDLGDRTASDTIVGTIMGTPAYMSPEQAQGSPAKVTPASDVYALGATLYDLLCERPPRCHRSVIMLVAAVAEGVPFEPPSRWAQAMPVDEVLDGIVVKALNTAPDGRYADAGELAEALASWLDGVRKRERAMALVLQADLQISRAAHAQAQALDYERQAEAALRDVLDSAPVEDKEAGWELSDQATRGFRTGRDHQARSVQLLRNALSHAPDLPEAHQRLADLFHARHQQLERDGRTEDARALELDLQEHDRTGQYRPYLHGTGAVSLTTDVPGVEVRLHRYVQQKRRLIPVFDRIFGHTPLKRVPLEMGHYLLTLHKVGHHEVRYPVWIRRQEHWDGVPPDATESLPIWMPPIGALADDDCYVPAGWFWSGDDHFAHRRDQRRMWAHAMIAKRHPVTVGEYLVYLNDLLDRGQTERAAAAQPTYDDSREPYFERDDEGRFVGIRTDQADEGWRRLVRGPLLPITLIDWRQAMDYAAWRSEREGLGWRLPMELEWQHAGRGADLRTYPWGDHFDANWCRMRNTAGGATIVSVEQHPEDVSPYGLRGMAGNSCDWALDPDPQLPAQTDATRIVVGSGASKRRLSLGGSCGSGAVTCAIAQRSRLNDTFRLARIGLRVFRPMGETDPPKPSLDRMSAKTAQTPPEPS